MFLQHGGLNTFKLYLLFLEKNRRKAKLLFIPRVSILGKGFWRIFLYLKTIVKNLSWISDEVLCRWLCVSVMIDMYLIWFMSVSQEGTCLLPGVWEWVPVLILTGPLFIAKLTSGIKRIEMHDCFRSRPITHPWNWNYLQSFPKYMWVWNRIPRLTCGLFQTVISQGVVTSERALSMVFLRVN